MAVTELIVLKIKPDAAADTVSSVLESSVATLRGAPGNQRVRWSHVVEDPHTVRLFVDWDDVKDHYAFAADAPVFGPFKERLGTVLAVPPQTPYHVEFAPQPAAVLDNKKPGARSLVAELLHAYFPADFADEAKAKTAAVVREFVKKMQVFADGLTGEVALGWTWETLEYKGEQCLALVAVLGWKSLEAHQQARQHEDFAKVVPMLRTLEGLKGMELVHVSNTTVE
ncbi:hypothetical protein GGS26DRAFT_477373 [Hypomontagnella submonticulosa]|nr:hypothetical protein GGS26DRAFT_477373 [Hypomontagnella submonticulosa]